MKKYLFIAALLIAFLPNEHVYAHCDGIDGPVVQAAKKSLETSNISFTLIWVKKEFETEVSALFNKTLSVRNLSPEAKEIADNYFFETVVRLHREGEGEPFTGLKPAGRDLGPAIPAADLALENNSVTELQNILLNSFQKRLHELFEHAVHSKSFNENDVEAGREFVESYVKFIHFAEKSYELNSEHNIHSVDKHKF